MNKTFFARQKEKVKAYFKDKLGTYWYVLDGQIEALEQSVQNIKHYANDKVELVDRSRPLTAKELEIKALLEQTKEK